jgi:SH3-like domain-containing protein
LGDIRSTSGHKTVLRMCDQPLDPRAPASCRAATNHDENMPKVRPTETLAQHPAMSQSSSPRQSRILALLRAAAFGVSALGLPVEALSQTAPGFASLMADNVEVRGEPGLEKPITLVFKRAGLPIAVLERRGNWARIQDSEGATGWVAADAISRRRTALVLSPAVGSGETSRALRSAARSTSDALAYLEPGVIVGIVECDGRICRITASGVRGFVDQQSLWGVSPGESVK